MRLLYAFENNVYMTERFQKICERGSTVDVSCHLLVQIEVDSKMDPLNSIENRVRELENKLGYVPEETTEKPVVEVLKTVQSSLNDIYSKREKVADMSKHLEELNVYLDPQYVDMVNDTKIKVNYLSINAPAIALYCNDMQMSQEILHVLSSDSLSDTTKLSETVDKLIKANMENADVCDQAEKWIQQMMETSYQLSSTVMDNLVSLHQKIDAFEKK